MNSRGPSREGWARRLVCSKTGESAPLDRPAFLSPSGRPWLVDYELDVSKGRDLLERLGGRPWSLWRYRELLPLARFDDRVDLGEGATPLFPAPRLGPEDIELWIKEEGGNPTGSFKARGLSLAVNRARELGAPGVQLPSAGNAALALSAYAAASGLPCRVAIPQDTPDTVRERCRAHGAEVLEGPGTLVEAGGRLADLERDVPEDERFWTLSTLKEPYRVEGKKTMGLELAEQSAWRLPDWILYPTGGGTGIVGMHKAFDELERLGLIDGRRPRFAVVQMEGCAPMVRAWKAGEESAEPWSGPETRVWGLRVPRAIGDFLVLRALRESSGTAVAVSEGSIDPRTREAARAGLLFGPEGAACLEALWRLRGEGTIEAGSRVVLFQTGHPANYL